MALSLVVDGRLIEAQPGQSLLAACLAAGLDIPYFCWHPALGAVGSCRQCAVKLFDDAADGQGRIVMACMTMPVAGMRLSIEDAQTAAFRAAMIETVLTSHPHDCPVCEVGGECHLQDMAVLTGHHERRHRFPKRTHVNQNLGPFIRHEMNRCIGCYRCVRYYRDYAGGDDFGVFGANRNIYFGRAADGVLESPFAGNLTEVCPTGVFVDKPFSAQYRRKWDLRATPSVCPHCAVGCNITVQERGGTLRRVVNRYHATLNGYFICDRGRFGPGFVNGPARLTAPRDRAGNRLSPRAAIDRLAGALREEGVIGIGSPRASVEANFALRALVGPANFYGGFSDFESAALQAALTILRRMRPATLGEMEAADGFVILGDDPVQVAPRLALSLRQAALRGANGAGGGEAFIIATDGPCWLDGVGRRAAGGTSLEFLGALLARLAGEAPINAAANTAANTVVNVAAEVAARALLGTRRPVIVAGGDAALLTKAANLVLALRRAGVGARLCLLAAEANSIGLGLLDARALTAAAAACAGRAVIVLERDLTRAAQAGAAGAGAAILAAARSVTVLDHVETAGARQADLAIAVASFAESDGVFVNLEGRAQAFFKAVIGGPEAPASWEVLREAGLAARRAAARPWHSHAALLADLAATVPALAACQRAWPLREEELQEGARPATLPHRHSGRTAATAHLDVREPMPARHADSPFGTTMEGPPVHSPPIQARHESAPMPASILGTVPAPVLWAPGWNSVQLAQKHPPEADPDADPDAAAGLFLFADRPARDFPVPPAGPRDDRTLGAEELSALSPAIAARRRELGP